MTTKKVTNKASTKKAPTKRAAMKPEKEFARIARISELEGAVTRVKELPHMKRERNGWRVFVGDLPYCYHVMKGAANQCVQQLHEIRGGHCRVSEKEHLMIW